MNIKELTERVHKACIDRGQKKNWSAGGRYIHLEVSEFIESLRGKRGSPYDEAADVLITFLAVVGEYKLDTDVIEFAVNKKLEAIEQGLIGDKHEDFTAQSKFPQN